MQFPWTCSLQTQSGAVFTSTLGRDRPLRLLLLASMLPAAESMWLYWRPVECQSDCQVRTPAGIILSSVLILGNYFSCFLSVAQELFVFCSKVQFVWLETLHYLHIYRCACVNVHKWIVMDVWREGGRDIRLVWLRWYQDWKSFTRGPC